MTKQEFAQKIKVKYPQYQDMSDDELADKMLAKYPQYKSSVETEPVATNAEKNAGMMSKFKKAAGYISSFASQGPMGLATQFVQNKVSEDPMKAAELATSFVKNTAETPIQLVRSGVAGASGLIANATGNQSMAELHASASKPINVPGLGEVKGLSAVPEDVELYGTKTPAQTLAQAGNMYLEAGAPGAGKLLTKATRSAGEVLGPFSKRAASWLSNTPTKYFDAAANPEMAKKITGLRELGAIDSPEMSRDIGMTVFRKAQQTRDKAMDAYKAARDLIITKNKGKIIQRARSFVDNVRGVLTENKIKIGEDGVDLIGSQFEGSGSAKAYLDRAHSLMTRPVANGSEAVDDLLTRREALSSMVFEVPSNEKNLKRVLNGMRSAFDSTLDDVLGESASVLRKEYAASMKPTENIISSMTTIQNGKRMFSQDRARRFIQEASSGQIGFDKREMLSELDTLVGSDFERTVEAIGIDKAISRLDPPTAGRVADIIKSFISKGTLGIFTPVLSPKFWGEVALGKGMKETKNAANAIEKSRAFTTWFLTNLITQPVRGAADAVATPQQ